ncbi:MAG: DUF1349 domain-containing protein [Woeseiaceae bacterium]|nr:DUF1349 domain-containing protein [Woeseiaceae bacterium]
MPDTNQLQNLTEDDPGEFRWLNDPVAVEFSEGTMSVTAPEKSDFFINPENNEVSASAPLFYREVEGDFVVTALVKPDFRDKWNAAAIMVHIDENNWIKFAFENSDATGKSIVTVVTRGVSDDANGVRLEAFDKVWLRLARKGNNFAMHWSSDGKTYVMARLAQISGARRVKVGLEAQSPVGQAVTHEFLYFNIEEKTVRDLRAGY